MYHSSTSSHRLLSLVVAVFTLTRRVVVMLALSAVFACAQLSAAEHLARDRLCDEQLCLQCQVAADDDGALRDGVLQPAACDASQLPHARDAIDRPMACAPCHFDFHRPGPAI